MQITTENIIALAVKIKEAATSPDRSTSWIDLGDEVVLVDVYNDRFKGLNLFIKCRPVGIIRDDTYEGPIEALTNQLKDMVASFIFAEVDHRANKLFDSLPEIGTVEESDIRVSVSAVGYTAIKVINISTEDKIVASYPWTVESKNTMRQAAIAKLKELIGESILSGRPGSITYTVTPYTAPESTKQ
jgi:hypothetical protein